MTSRTRMWGLRPFVKRFVNPINRRFAGRLPGFGILTFQGRKSGRMYQTPINVLRQGDDYVFVLTYGSDVDWVKGVLAAGGCSLRTRGHDVRLTHPELVIDPSRSLVPAPVRIVGRLANVTEFIRMRAEADPASAAA